MSQDQIDRGALALYNHDHPSAEFDLQTWDGVLASERSRYREMAAALFEAVEPITPSEEQIRAALEVAHGPGPGPLWQRVFPSGRLETTCVCGSVLSITEDEFHNGEAGRAWNAHESEQKVRSILDLLDRQDDDGLVVAKVSTRHPESYTLHNGADGTAWRMTDDGHWKATLQQGSPTRGEVAREIHAMLTYRFNDPDACRHGEFSGGPLNGEQYRMCMFIANLVEGLYGLHCAPSTEQLAALMKSWGVKSAHGEWTDEETQINVARDIEKLYGKQLTASEVAGEVMSSALHPEFGTEWREPDGTIWKAIQQATADAIQIVENVADAKGIDVVVEGQYDEDRTAQAVFVSDVLEALRKG